MYILNFTFGSANQYFYKSNISRHVWQDMNILENPTTVSTVHEYCRVPYTQPDMV
jgi:hypothetical protein